MVLSADPIFSAMEALDTPAHAPQTMEALDTPAHASQKKKALYMSPRGRIIDREKLEELATFEEIVILCGHYEGVDQRVLDHWEMEEVSIGDYVLTGGELPAMVLIDALARFLPRVMATTEAAVDESIYSGLLEYPQYTKPREYRNMEVPPVLFGGNHRHIHLWKLEQSLRLTKERRPDLFKLFLANSHHLDKEEKKILDMIVDESVEIKSFGE